MIIISADQYLNPLTFAADYTVPVSDFKPFYDRIISQLIKTVQVPGFRPGRVPEKLALQHLDPKRVDEIMVEETINKFLPEAIASTKTKLQAENRIILGQQLEFKTNSGEQEDRSFKFSLNFSLLPQVDLEKALALKLPVVETKDIPELLSIEKFLEREEDLLLKNVNNMKTKDNLETYKMLDEAFETDVILQKQYTSLEEFRKLLGGIYTQELENTKNRLVNDKLISQLIKVTPDFDLPESLLNAEVERLTKAIVQKAAADKVTLEQAWSNNPFNKDKVKAKSESDIATGVRGALHDEFKLMYTLRFVHETMVEDKVEDGEIQELVKRMQERPDLYDLPDQTPLEEIENRAYDQAMRNKAFAAFRRKIEGN